MTAGNTEQAKAAEPEPLGLYVHVPFCASTCDFCAFYQIKPTREGVECFLTGVDRELAVAMPAGRKAGTVFWGGGTPGLLPPSDLGRLGRAVAGVADPGPRTEWTVEMAPASVTEDRLKALKDLGVNRVSMGVQSFSPDWLDALGRMHTREQVYRAYERIRAAGFENVNLDLMFALPGQSEAEWGADVKEAVRLGPEHISTYCLTFEEDTALWVKLSQGRVKLDPEKEAAMYEKTWEWLGEAGYAQYEISNFAKAGRACRHNLNTWAMHEWVGVGPAAASQCSGRRGRNVSDLAQWSAGLEKGIRANEDEVVLTPELLAEDALIFGLRKNEGVNLSPWRRRAPTAPWPEWDDRLNFMATEGLLTRTGDTVRLTLRGRLLADRIAADLVTASAKPNG